MTPDPDRPIALALVLDAYRRLKLDATEEIEGIDAMSADELLDELQYLADYQG